jgi:hypothetical protein
MAGELKTNWDDPGLPSMDQAGELGGKNADVSQPGPNGLTNVNWAGEDGPVCTAPGGERSPNSVSGLSEVQINDMYPSPATPPEPPGLLDRPADITIDEK